MTSDELVQIMAAKLRAFEDGSMRLHQVVGELQALNDNLDTPEVSWVEQFNKELFALEEVNAVRLDEDYAGKNTYDDFVQEKVSRIRALVEHYPEVIR